MQVFVIALFLLTLVFSQEPASQTVLPQLQITGWPLLIVVVAPKLLIAFAYALLCRNVLRSLSKGKSEHPLRRLDRITSLYRFTVLLLYFGDIVLGAMTQLHSLTGPDLLVVNELLFMIPPLVMVVWSWWVYYPIDRRLRDAQLIRRIDEGKPIGPIWTRNQYVIAQLRYQMAPMFALLAVLFTLSQIVEGYFPAEHDALPIDPRLVIHFCAAGCIFLFAPVVIRHIWDTSPLPDGAIRNRLTELCRQYRVGVRELLVWQTFGGMANAAVMGLVRPLRYILLSDALLELLPQRQVEAVMAHELAHVRRHHMFSLLLVAVTLLSGLFVVWSFAALVATTPLTQLVISVYAEPSEQTVASITSNIAKGIEGSIITASFVCWFLAFGWFSRRIERQADTFAVKHLATESAADLAADQGRQQPVVIDPISVSTMIEALGQVARLNNIDPQKRSWRHGSIAWRQNYLRSLVGHPADRLPNDHLILVINSVTPLIFLIATYLALHRPH